MVARSALKRQPFAQIVNDPKPPDQGSGKTDLDLSDDWRGQLRGAAITPDRLLERLNLPAALLQGMHAGARMFPLRVPESFIQRIRPGDVNDPLLRQVLPLQDETVTLEGFGVDPVGDLHSHTAPGILHKYHGRALLVVTGACAVNCRYCFRRHFPYAEQQIKPAQWQQTLAYLRADTSISEVIFSGGDPLVLGTAKLSRLTDDLSRIPHLRRLRIHTRLPVVLPARITADLCAWLDSLPWPASMVLHVNHPHEIDADLQHASHKIHAAGCILLNQAVLLQGVNDDAETQRILSEKLFESGIIPYYLHLLDPVAGAGHFHINESHALAIYAEMRRTLPGYLLPRLVREVAGKNAKQPVSEIS